MNIKWMIPIVGAVFAAANPAASAVIGGIVNGGTGNFVEITDTTGLSVGDDVQQNNNTVFAFNEDQNIILPDTLMLGFDYPRPEYQFTLTAGTVVASHYVFFDPAGTRSVEAEISFDADILAVAGFTQDMFDTDFLANNSVTYLNPGYRGIEIAENYSFEQDSYSFSGSTLSIDFTASSPGDYIRVFTAQSSSGPDPRLPGVPLPASGWMLLAGVAGVAGLRRKARS